MRFHSYFNTTIKILGSYDGSVPLSYFLKKYFSENKKHGSKDRRFIAHACYCYFRPGHALQELNIEERLKAAIFLCNENAGEWNILYDGEWLKHWSNSLQERISFIASLYGLFSLDKVFPYTEQLSEGIDTPAFIQSHFIQPGVFLRIRPHHHEHVVSALKEHNVSFNLREDDCIELAASINVENILKPDEEVVVQDYSSQQIKKYLQLFETGSKNPKSEIRKPKSEIQDPKSEIQDPKSEIRNPKSQIRNPKLIWDCCAGSGGKSILAYDVLENIQLTATDVRPAIIHNLQKRFQKAGIKIYNSLVTDITKPLTKALPFPQDAVQGSGEGFDLIICDAPCTGSGTWSRTPEQLFFFKEAKINEYVSLQQSIITNAISKLKAGAYFLYITCSVFRRENEEIVDLIQKKHLRLIEMELLKGYDKRADTMFAALFQN